MIKKNKMKSIALFMYAPPFHFQPTTNAANLLAEKGFIVHLIGIEKNDDWFQQLNKEIKLVYLSKEATGLRGVLLYIWHIFYLRFYLWKNHIDCIIGYDAKSVIPAFCASRFTKIKWFYHQHDYFESPVGAWQRFLWVSERRLVKYADYITFPQIERADLFEKIGSLKKYPDIVFNGPRRKWLNSHINASVTIKDFRSRFEYVLIYQGGWSFYFGIERIFDALACCKTNTSLIVLGEERDKGIRSFYSDQLKKLGIADRVYLANKYIPYEELPSYTMFADAAVAILTDEFDEVPYNNRYLIGASNKITEYVACGLPVIMQNSDSSRLFQKRYPIGVLTDTKDKVVFANTIDCLLEEKAKRKLISDKNKLIFMEELNFDVQFDKVVCKLI